MRYVLLLLALALVIVVWLLLTPIGIPQTDYITNLRYYSITRWLDELDPAMRPRATDCREANSGIEALVALAIRSESARAILDELGSEAMTDTDSDGNPEICDAWGTPFVYIHSDNYGARVAVSGIGGDVRVVRHLSNTDGEPCNRGAYQLFSLDWNELQDGSCSLPPRVP